MKRPASAMKHPAAAMKHLVSAMKHPAAELNTAHQPAPYLEDFHANKSGVLVSEGNQCHYQSAKV
jgi:hypothetical protein